MTKSYRSNAEERFAANQKRAQRAHAEYEMEQQARAEKTAKLRLLRIAKESAAKAHAKNNADKK